MTEPLKTDAPLDLLHGMPPRDVMLAACAAYYADGKGELRAEGRAVNGQIYKDDYKTAWGDPDSPFDFIEARNDRTRGHRFRGLGDPRDLGGASMIALRHKATGKVVVAMAGLESDGTKGASGKLNAFGDGIDDLLELGWFKMSRQTPALRRFCAEIGQREHQKPVIIAHSMATIPAMSMALHGYDSIQIEPRRLNDDLMRRIGLLAHAAGRSRESILKSLKQHRVTITSTHVNDWSVPSNGQPVVDCGCPQLAVEVNVGTTGMKRRNGLLGFLDPGHRIDTMGAALAGLRDDITARLTITRDREPAAAGSAEDNIYGTPAPSYQKLRRMRPPVAGAPTRG